MKLYLNARDDQISLNKKHYLLRAAKRMGLEDSVLDMAIHPFEKMEYVLNIEPFTAFIKGAKWTGIWEIDVMFDRAEMTLSNWVCCDVVFVANSNVPKRMNFNGNIVTLFQACDPILHKRLAMEPEYDFIQCGTGGGALVAYESRGKTIARLCATGFSFCDYGKGYPPTEYVEKLNHARVQFIRSAGKYPWTSQVEQRFFECLAIGPVLKDYHKDLHALGLIEGIDYFSYKDDGEMITKMDILLGNPEFAQKMAISGRKKAITYHSYENRLAAILVHINEKSYD